MKVTKITFNEALEPQGGGSMSRNLPFRVSLFVLVLVLLGFALTAGGRDRGQFMFVDELQPGMTGYCKTAINGNQIVKFNFTIVDILRHVGLFRTDLEYEATILARTEDDFWTAAGMSGSPCYVNDKLIGALFAAYYWSTPHTGPGHPFLIQPIEAMLPVLDACLQKAPAPIGTTVDDELFGYLPPGDRTIAATSLTGKTNIRQIKLVSTPPSSQEIESHPQTLFVHYLATPVTVTGLSERAFKWLQDGIKVDLQGSVLRYLRGKEKFEHFVNLLSRGLEERYDVVLYNMGNGGQIQGVDPGPLEPGAPLGSAVMLGDVSYGGYGTVTYIENNCLLAYGHPDWLLGDTDLFMTSAYIADVIRSLRWPFKEGYLVEEVGSVVEDRLTAIAGAIGRPAKAIQFNLKVTDKSTGVTKSYSSKSVTLPAFYPTNLLIAGLGAVDKVMNRQGPGTLNAHLLIKDVNGRTMLEWSDIYVSDYDIAAEGTFDPAWITELLAWNEFTEPQIGSIDLDLTVDTNIRVKVIESVEPEQRSISRGGRLRYKVRLQSYRGDPETIRGSLEIPSWASKDDIIYLEAFPANWAFWKFEHGPRYGAGLWARPTFLWDTILDLTGLIQAIQEAPTNDLLLVVAWSATQGGAYAIDIKSVGDFVVDGDRESENIVQVK